MRTISKRIILVILGLAAILLAVIESWQLAEEELESPDIEHVIFPEQFVNTDSLAQIRFLKDDSAVLVGHMSYTGSSQQGVDLLDLRTGKVKELLRSFWIQAISEPDSENEFLIARLNENKIELDRYSTNGTHVKNLGSVAVQNGDSRTSDSYPEDARVFWQRENDRAILINAERVFRIQNEKFDQIITLEKQPELFGCALVKDRLYAGVKDSLEVYDVTTGELINKLTTLRQISAIAVSPDARIVLVGCDGKVKGSGVVFVVKMNGGDFKNEFEIADRFEYETEVWRLQFVNEHRAIASTPGSSMCIDLQTGEIVWKETWAAFASNSGKLVAVCDRSRVRLIDSETGESARTLRGHSKVISSLTISPDFKTVVSAQRDGQMFEWQVETGKLEKRSRLIQPVNMSGIHSHEKPVVWELDESGHVVLKHVDTDGETLNSYQTRLETQPEWASPLPNGDLVAVVNDGELSCFMFGEASDEPKHSFKIAGNLEADTTLDFDLSDISERLIVSLQRYKPDPVRKLLVFNLVTGELVFEFEHVTPIRQAFFANQDFLAYEFEGEIIVRQIADGNQFRKIKKPFGAIFSSYAMSPDNRLLACSYFKMKADEQGLFHPTDDHRIAVFSIRSEKRLRDFIGHEEGISCLRFSDDSSKLVSADQMGKIIVWSLENVSESADRK